MSKTSKIVGLIAGLLFALGASLALAADTPAAPAAAAKGAPATATPAAKKAQTMCPVMNSEINKKLFVDKDGKRIYMCCPMCKEKIEKDFDKIAKDLEAKGIDLTIPKDAAQPAAPPTPKPAEPAK